MKSSFFKKAAIIVAVVLVIALIPAFARGHNRMGNNNGHNGSNYNDSSYNGNGCNGGNCNGRGYNEYNSNSSSRHGSGNYQIGGTIKFIDTDASTISVANADGALTIVHINPTTSIIDATDLDTMRNSSGHMNYMNDIDTTDMTDAEIRLEYFNAREAAIEEWEAEIEDRTLAFDNLDIDYWVEVSTASTGTVTREATAVSVYR